MADPYAIEEEVNRILNKKNKYSSFSDLIKGTVSDKVRNVGQVAAVRDFGATAAGDPTQAYITSRQRYQEASAAGDTQAATFWGNAMTSLQSSLGALDSGGGGGDPYGYANALAGIYGTAAQLGTAKASAAAKKLEAALEQAKMTQQSDYVAGWEPRGIVSGALNMPWGGIGDAGKYTKVQVDSPDSITQGYDQGFNDTLAALLGSLGGGGGGSASTGASASAGGGTSDPAVAASPTTPPMTNETTYTNVPQPPGASNKQFVGGGFNLPPSEPGPTMDFNGAPVPAKKKANRFADIVNQLMARGGGAW